MFSTYNTTQMMRFLGHTYVFMTFSQREELDGLLGYLFYLETSGRFGSLVGNATKAKHNVKV